MLLSFVPYLTYRDAATALDWLERAFGFERTQSYVGGDGRIVHAEVAFGAGVAMMRTGDPSRGSFRRSGVHVLVDDVDGHHRRAAAAGARVIEAPTLSEMGTRRYRALDLDGYEWTFREPVGVANGAPACDNEPREAPGAAMDDTDRAGRAADRSVAGAGHR
jgi:uncharacterized glyoxalase superfamily protein PhnB